MTCWFTSSNFASMRSKTIFSYNVKLGSFIISLFFNLTIRATTGSRTAIVFGASLSNARFISFSSRPNWTTFSFPVREQFTLSMNSFSISGEYPRFFSPRMVKSRGSSQPSTTPSSMNCLIFRLDRAFPSMLRREYSQTVGL